MYEQEADLFGQPLFFVIFLSGQPQGLSNRSQKKHPRISTNFANEETRVLAQARGFIRGEGHKKR